MFKCLIDNAEFASEKELHNYISRRLKVKLEDYYPKYHPRYDLQSGEPIQFKNKEFYSHNLFNNRENLIEYFKHNKDVEVLKECIRLRKESKNLRFAPSTVEARTCILPSPALVKRIGFDYNQICQDLGLHPRYDYSQTLETDPAPLKVLVDTREQRPLPIHGEVTVSKLDFGDYTSTSHYKKVFIERKSLVDLCGTLSAGFERFQREISRAMDMGSYLVVCVEENIKQMAVIGRTPETSKVQASPDFFGVRIRSLCQQFPNVQFLFVDGRVRMSQIIEKVLRLKNDVSKLDLQFFYDSKLL